MTSGCTSIATENEKACPQAESKPVSSHVWTGRNANYTCMRFRCFLILHWQCGTWRMHSTCCQNPRSALMLLLCISQ